MKRLRPGFRLVALFGALALVAAAVGFSTTDSARELASKFARSVGSQRDASPADPTGMGTGDSTDDASDRNGSAVLKPQGGAAVHANPSPQESRLVRAQPFKGDLRNLPYIKPAPKERPERRPPDTVPVPYGLPAQASDQPDLSASALVPAVAAPAPIENFDGLDFATWGDGHPPDTNGDVGPT